MSNGETKDGLRDGAVVFDEIHQFESNKDVSVHISGLGKKANPRNFTLVLMDGKPGQGTGRYTILFILIVLKTPTPDVTPIR